MFTLHYAQVGDGLPGRSSEPEVTGILIPDGVKFAAAGVLVWAGMLLIGGHLLVPLGFVLVIGGIVLMLTALGLPGRSLPDFRPIDIDIDMLALLPGEYRSDKNHT